MFTLSQAEKAPLLQDQDEERRPVVVALLHRGGERKEGHCSEAKMRIGIGDARDAHNPGRWTSPCAESHKLQAVVRKGSMFSSIFEAIVAFIPPRKDQ